MWINLFIGLIKHIGILIEIVIKLSTYWKKAEKVKIRQIIYSLYLSIYTWFEKCLWKKKYIQHNAKEKICY